MRRDRPARSPHGATPDRILIVEDHPLFAEALQMMVEAKVGAQVVRRAATLAAALECLARDFGDAGPGAVLLDLGLPDISGLDGLARMRAAAPTTPILVITSLADRRLTAAALETGADGVLTKDASPQALAEAVHAVWSGQRVAPDLPADGGGDAVDPGADAARRIASLTPQQARILELVCEGMLNKQIAFGLDIAETTVKAHISAILRKLGVQSRTQAVLAAQKVRFAAFRDDDAN